MYLIIVDVREFAINQFTTTIVSFRTSKVSRPTIGGGWRETIVWAVAWIAWGGVWTTQLFAHEFEDGFVERAMAVVVRADSITVNYSIGANELTRRQLVTFWQKSSQLKNQPPATFLNSVGAAVANRIDVQLNGQIISLNLKEVLPTPRHHVEATVVLEVPLAALNLIATKPTKDGVFSLKITDRNFRRTSVQTADERDPAPFDGAFRYALKPSRGVILTNCSAAPILVRADRQLSADLSVDQLRQASVLEADVIFPPRTKTSTAGTKKTKP